MPTILGTEPRSRLIEYLMRARYVSLHDGEPLDGAHELGGPFYERQSIVWDEDARNAGEVRFMVPRCDITHIGFWEDRAGGTFVAANVTQAKHCEEGDTYRIAPRLLAFIVTGA